MGITIASTPSPLLTGIGLFAAGLNNYRQQQSQFLQQQQLQQQAASNAAMSNMTGTLAHQIGNYYQGQTSLANQKDLATFNQGLQQDNATFMQGLQNQQAAGGMTADQEQAAANATVMGPPPQGVDQNAWNLSQYRQQRGLDQQAANLGIQNDALGQQLAIRNRAAMEQQYRMPMPMQQQAADQWFAQNYQQGPPGPGGMAAGPSSTPNSRLTAWQQEQDMQSFQRAGQGQAAMDAAKARQAQTEQIQDVTHRIAMLDMDPNAASNPQTPQMRQQLQQQLTALQMGRAPINKPTAQQQYDEEWAFKQKDGTWSAVIPKGVNVHDTPLAKAQAAAAVKNSAFDENTPFEGLPEAEQTKWVNQEKARRRILTEGNPALKRQLEAEELVHPEAMAAQLRDNAANLRVQKILEHKSKIGTAGAPQAAPGGPGAPATPTAPGQPPPQIPQVQGAPPPQPLPPGGFAQNGQPAPAPITRVGRDVKTGQTVMFTLVNGKWVRQ